MNNFQQVRSFLLLSSTCTHITCYRCNISIFSISYCLVLTILYCLAHPFGFTRLFPTFTHSPDFFATLHITNGSHYKFCQHSLAPLSLSHLLESVMIPILVILTYLHLCIIFASAVNYTLFCNLYCNIQLNPAPTDFKGPINFICYRRNSVTANIGACERSGRS